MNIIIYLYIKEIIYVLPVPGGPYNRIPFQGENGPAKKTGYLRGYTIASLIAVLQSSKPTTSSQCTFKFSNTISYITKDTLRYMR